MNDDFVFGTGQISKLFPFYIEVDKNLMVTSSGKSLQKICPVMDNQEFSELFTIIRPGIQKLDFETLKSCSGQLVIMELSGGRSIKLRGQFELIPDRNSLIFIGSPWFGSMDQVRERNLTLHDFAIHDPMIDLLHVIKTQELAATDLKNLLSTISRQKEQLKKAAKEIEDIALFPMQNPDPLVRIDTTGKVLIMNPQAVNIAEFRYKGIVYDYETFWKTIAAEIDLEAERWSFEAESGGKDYSFTCKFIREVGYINIYGRDITQTKIRDENYRLLSLIAEDNINAVVICNEKGRIEWVNKSYTQMTGYSREELIGKSPGSLLQGPESEKETINYIKARIEKGEPFNCEILNYAKSGKKYWVRILGQAFRDKEGKIKGFFALEEDITKARESQEKIRESESRLTVLIQNLQEGILLEDQYRKIVYINQKFCDMFKIPLNPELMIGMDCSMAAEQSKYLFKDEEGFVNEINNLLHNKKTVTSDVLELKDGRFFERDFVPVFMQYQYNGHLWKYSDITARKNYEKTLKLREEKYRNIIENMNLGMIEVDENDIIQSANQSFSSLTGYTKDELLGKTASEILLPPEEKEILLSKNSLRKAGISDIYEVEGIKKEGEPRWWLISGAPNYDDEGKYIGTIGIHLDITEQKKMENELIKAKMEAEESSKAKENFLANMSHEIRTPLNAIIGLMREIAREPLTRKQNQYLTNAGTAAEHLLSIINNVLDISKIEAGELQLENRHFSLSEIIEGTKQIMSAISDEKLIQIEIKNSPELLPAYNGDPARIRQILINIVGNAIKFTEKGKIFIECLTTPTSENQHRVLISVKDTGIGMDQSFQKNLFKKFSQEENSTTRRQGGTGLGMAITYELVHLMNGSIEVISEKGQGTTFNIWLPLAPGEAEKIEPGINNESFEILRDLKVLLVEDNELNRLVATSLMQNYGMVVVETENGQEAINLLKSESFDLIFMDLQMPVMDGLTATRHIRNELKLTTPIIALTANAFKKELEKCIAAGMNDYIIKPFEEDVYLHTVLKTLGRNSENNPKVKQAVIQQVKHAGKLFDLENLVALSRGNTDFIKKMVNLFTDQIPDSFRIIHESFAKKDISTIRTITHRIRPSIENMGITVIREDMKQLELLAAENPDSEQIPVLIEKTWQVLSKAIGQLKEEFPGD
jgi:PAS domain S-box-containing protein